MIIDALIPLLVIGLPLGLVSFASDARARLKRTEVQRLLRGATRL
jgi:precorrin isomerase